jgi:RNA polymerase sigma-70 factor, ECF subfamily
MKKDFDLEMALHHLAEGNPFGIEEIYCFYYPKLYRFSKKLLKLEAGIDDIIQEVFLKIWQNRNHIKSADTFNAFIFTITRNLLLNELRNRLNNQKMRDKIGKLSVSTEYSLVEEEEYYDIKRIVDQAINELPSRQKEIFRLSRDQGLSYKEIAHILHITPKTVEFHISKSIVLMRRKLFSLEV